MEKRSIKDYSLGQTIYRNSYNGLTKVYIASLEISGKDELTFTYSDVPNIREGHSEEFSLIISTGEIYLRGRNHVEMFLDKDIAEQVSLSKKKILLEQKRSTLESLKLDIIELEAEIIRITK